MRWGVVNEASGTGVARQKLPSLLIEKLGPISRSWDSSFAASTGRAERAITNPASVHCHCIVATERESCHSHLDADALVGVGRRGRRRRLRPVAGCWRRFVPRGACRRGQGHIEHFLEYLLEDSPADSPPANSSKRFEGGRSPQELREEAGIR